MTLSYKIPESVLVVIHADNLDVLLLERADKPGFLPSLELCYIVPGIRH